MIEILVIDLVNKYVKNSRWRYVVSVIFSLVAGAVLAFMQYGNDVWNNAGLIFVSSQSIYKLWYEKSQLKARIRTL